MPIRQSAVARAPSWASATRSASSPAEFAVGADKPDGKALPALRRGDTYSLDVGGSYSLSKRIAVTGGVRYNVERDRLTALQDDRRDSQAVYIGTAFKF